MSGRRHRVAFRPDTTSARRGRPSRGQAVAMLAILVVVAGTLTTASFAVRPSAARAFTLFYGSVFINDNTAPVAVDLASGRPSVRLTNAYTEVSAGVSGDLDVIPLVGGTLLLDTATGEFNMLDTSGFALKQSGGGVALPQPADTTTATAVPAGAAAYIVRGTTSGTSVYLVGQAAVSAAAGGGKARPRAAISMTTTVRDAATTTVSANPTGRAGAASDLWLLAGAGTRRTIRQLHVPAASGTGATLAVHDHGTVAGVAAIAASTPGAGDSGGEEVAVASSGAIEIFAGAGTTGGEMRRVAVAGLTGVDRILPATNQHGSFAFLYHDSAGWRLVEVATGAGVARSHPLPAITGTDLATPAMSGGALYTMDRRTGALWRIGLRGDATPIPGAGAYPLLPGETRAFDDATVFARGTRVIVNSRANLEALTVFSDGGHAPVVVDKRTAVDLDSTGAALAEQHIARPGPTPRPTRPTPTKPPSEPVTDTIDCKNTTQIPHIPQLGIVGTGSRSVQLRWTYPLLDRQDCAPSTYTVTTRVASGTAPPPPGTVRVQGVDGVTLTGLFPDTQYRVVVDAYINTKHTASAPVLVRTQPEGPAAPTDVRVDTDAAGGWQLSWHSCGGVAQGCVPVESWTIAPQLCESRSGLISAPANGHLVGDPTTHTFTYTYPATPDLLGAGLRFTIEGVGDRGTVGDPATSRACRHSWGQPRPEHIHVAASTPPPTAQGSASSTVVSVTVDGSRQAALGGAGAQLVYELLYDGAAIKTVGPTEATTATLRGVAPGIAYQVRVIVRPPGHRAASVALGPFDVAAAVSSWPAMTLTSSFSTASGTPTTGTLSLRLRGLRSAEVRGESFDLTDSALVCGNTAMPLTTTDWDPARPLTFDHVDRGQLNGSCVVRLSLTEDPATVGTPAYFGGIASPVVVAPAIPIPVPVLDASDADFVANFVHADLLSAPQIAVAYRGDNRLIAPDATGWSLRAQYQSGTTWVDCGDPATGNPARAPVVLHLDGSCYYANHTANWRVTVTLGFFGQSPPVPYAVSVNRSGPQPVDPAAMSFTATWAHSSIAVGYDGPYPDATLRSLHWTQTVTSSTSGTVCASDTGAPSNGAPMLLTVDPTACPSEPPGSPAPSATYTVHIHFTDPNYGNAGDYTVTVAGTPS